MLIKDGVENFSLQEFIRLTSVLSSASSESTVSSIWGGWDTGTKIQTIVKQ